MIGFDQIRPIDETELTESFAMKTNSSESEWMIEFERVRSNRIESDRIRPIDKTGPIESVAMETNSSGPVGLSNSI